MNFNILVTFVSFLQLLQQLFPKSESTTLMHFYASLEAFT